MDIVSSAIVLQVMMNPKVKICRQGAVYFYEKAVEAASHCNKWKETKKEISQKSKHLLY